MAFRLVTGIMGSGKSYFGAETCLKAWREGAHVHTNLPLNLEEVKRHGFMDKLTVLDGHPRDWVRKEADGTLVSDVLVMGKEGAENVIVFDEASLAFDIDDQSTTRQANKPIFQLVALCRHGGLDLFFLAQSSANVDAKLRRMAVERIGCIKALDIPVFGPLIRRFFGDFRRNYYRGDSSHRENSQWVRFSSEVGNLYETHGMRAGLKMKESAGRVKSEGADRKKGRRLLWLGVLAVGFVWGATKHFTSGKLTTDADRPAQTADGGGKGAAGIVGELVGVKAPPAKRRAPGMIEVEWDVADEHVISSVLTVRNKVSVQGRNGVRLEVGGCYQGEHIDNLVQWNGWYYFQTASSRWVVARPITAQERKQIWDSLRLPSGTPLASGWAQSLREQLPKL